jgi:hypothetical protein
MRVSSPDKRKSRLNDLSKDELVELVHTVSENYEEKLREQKRRLLDSVRAELHADVWPCDEHECATVTADILHFTFVSCHTCEEMNGVNNARTYCRTHNTPDKWYFVEGCEAVAVLYPQLEGATRMCGDCYNLYLKYHARKVTGPCGCIITHNGVNGSIPPAPQADGHEPHKMN